MACERQKTPKWYEYVSTIILAHVKKHLLQKPWSFCGPLKFYHWHFQNVTSCFQSARYRLATGSPASLFRGLFPWHPSRRPAGSRISVCPCGLRNGYPPIIQPYPNISNLAMEKETALNAISVDFLSWLPEGILAKGSIECVPSDPSRCVHHFPSV